MNRVIKFRGKRLDNSEWIYGYYVKDPKGNHRIYWKPFEDATSNTYHFVDPETVGQFASKIYGQEIYEGDCDAIGNVVEFVGGSWCLNGDRDLTSEFIKTGNIYEQKESL